eukprot:gnl/MRDRNA2_/MRDRNA2_48732_c0_seq2.p1 gnl/MRDRNA2_/MRDRNA2_48732_c0~~gnl/MRDRNA2_/MRDRNA2_48732_c0_seq2.p1  ORF type:complete len:233 (-),score=17.44 gnl/MRDRNA2_/MRDRNA2_48732_c0_seq2:196-894(-)
MTLSTHLRGKTYYYAGTGYPAWSWYVSFIHNGIVNLALLVAIVWLHPPVVHWNEWLTSQWVDLKVWDNLRFADKVDAIALCLGIAAELKDTLLLDIKLTSFSLGLLLHHYVTICGCLGCFYVPVGRGIVVLNSVNAYLGSSTFNIATTTPIVLPEFTSLHRLGRYLYYAGMTASNIAGLYLAYAFDNRTATETSVNPWYARAYWIATWMLVILREGAVSIIIGNLVLCGDNR